MTIRSPLEIVRRAAGAGRGWVVSLKGTLDERLSHSGFVEGLDTAVVFDLDGVTRVTSFGVRDWVHGLKALQADTYAFINCRPSLVSQFNMVAKFGGKGTLVSLFAPYSCDECGAEKEVLIDLRLDHQKVARGEVPVVDCDACSSKTEFDDWPSQYFAYAASRPRPALPPRLRQLVEWASRGTTNRTPGEDAEGVVTTVEVASDGNVIVKRYLEGSEGYVLFDMRGVTNASPEGLAALFASLDPSKHYLLGCVPIEHFGAFRAFGNATPLAVIASVLLRAPCMACGETRPVELDNAQLAEACTKGATTLVCPYCGAREEWAPPAAIAMSGAGVFLRHVAERLATPNIARLIAAGWAVERSTQFYGDFEKLKRLGTGGMAEVFLARKRGPEGFQKDAVLKLILPSLAEDQTVIAMFLQEARVAALISHPNVVQTYDLGRKGETYFITMEYVDGWDLAAVLKTLQRRHLAMPIAIACRVVSDICAGLQAAHSLRARDGESLGVVHRDVSPHNVLLSHEGMVKLTDFGVAKVTRSVVQSEPGLPKGKMSYMAPEQLFDDQDETGPSTDVFGAGIVLFECLTGSPSLPPRERLRHGAGHPAGRGATRVDASPRRAARPRRDRGARDRTRFRRTLCERERVPRGPRGGARRDGRHHHAERYRAMARGAHGRGSEHRAQHRPGAVG